MNILSRIRSFSVSSLYHDNSNSTRSNGYTGRIAVLLSVICLLCIPVMTLAQTQLGGDIDGEAAYNYLGAVSLSADGHRLAVGADQNDNNGNDAGQVRIYEWLGSGWVQIGADIYGEAAFDESGHAVSLSADGNRVAIGAHVNHGSGEFSGHVRVYQWSGSAWSQMGADIDGEAAYDNFGESVSISSDGNRVAAHSEWSGGAGPTFGHVRVFEWSGSDWVQMGSNINGKASYDGIRTVSLSGTGDHVALGAHRANTETGQARVYQWSGDAWVQLGNDIDAETTEDWFGYSVALSGDGTRLAAGAPANDDAASFAGHVRVFEWSGSTWVQLGNDIDGGGEENWFGSSVSLSLNGNRLAASAPNNSDNGPYAGEVRVYQWSNNTWTQIGSDLNGEAGYDNLGYRVALSGNGNRLAASADHNDGGGTDSGHARVYDLSMFDVFQINPGLNDHWYNPVTDGQGCYITVFPVLGKVNLTCFTYDTEQPSQGATANFGDPGHRWFNVLGRYDGNQAVMNIKIASGGLFDTPATEAPVTRVLDGTVILTFESCASGTIEYDIPSIGRTGIWPIQRIVGDNIPLCEAYLAQ